MPRVFHDFSEPRGSGRLRGEKAVSGGETERPRRQRLVTVERADQDGRARELGLWQAVSGDADGLTIDFHCVANGRYLFDTAGLGDAKCTVELEDGQELLIVANTGGVYVVAEILGPSADPIPGPAAGGSMTVFRIGSVLYGYSPSGTLVSATY